MDLAELYNLDAGDIKKSATRALALGRVVDKTADYIRRDVKDLPGIWKGYDADTAGTTLTLHSNRLETAGQAIRKAHKIIDQLAEALDRESKGVRSYVASINSRVGIQASGYYTIDVSTGAVDGGPGTTDAGAQAVVDGYMEYVKRATEADTLAAHNLTGIDELEKQTEAANAYRDNNMRRWDADEEDADRSADLINIAKTGKLSKNQRDELELLLSQNATDKQFAGDFLDNEKFGGVNASRARSIVDAYAALAAEGNNTVEIQKSLGNMIATGVDTRDNPDALNGAWITGFKDAYGAEYKVNINGRDTTISGSSIAAPWFEFGDFSGKDGTEFLNGVAETAYQESKNASAHEYAKFGSGVSPYFNPNSPNHGNPLNSILVSLRNNPEAATKFFGESKDYQSKIAHVLAQAGASEDALADFGAGGAYDVKDFLDYGRLDPNVVGDALEAASTRRDFDAHIQLDQTNDANNAKVFSAIVDHIGHNKEYAAFRGPDARLGELGDNIAKISTYYIDDIHKAMNDNTKLNYAWSQNDQGAPVAFVPGTLRGFLVNVGQNPDAYYGLKTASQAYTKIAVQQSHGDTGITNIILGSHVNVMNDLSDGAIRAKEAGAWFFASQNSVNKTVDNVKPVVDYLIDKFAISPATKPGSRLDGFGPEAGAIEGQITDNIAKYIKDEAGVNADEKTKADQNAWRGVEIKSVRDFLNTTAAEAYNHYTNKRELTLEAYIDFTGTPQATKYENDIKEVYDPDLDENFKPRAN